ncbi:hypothetical protein [Sphaerisporangium aureirubrum]|uniref:Uncharacterized protein n=1 Tax=Sphaerisporangium aureirubrum TaxID=1544736 RepID=A0ABW1NE01_9ACTN
MRVTGFLLSLIFAFVFLGLIFDARQAAVFTSLLIVPWGLTAWLLHRQANRVLWTSRRELLGLTLLRFLPLLPPMCSFITDHDAGIGYTIATAAVLVPITAAGAYISLRGEERFRLRQGLAVALRSGDRRRMIAACEAELRKAGAPAHRSWLTMNLAYALYNLSLESYDRHALERAARLLTSVAENDTDPERRFSAADLLVDVTDSFERSEGDNLAIEQATERMIAAAEGLLHIPEVLHAVNLRRFDMAFIRLSVDLARMASGLSPSMRFVDDFKGLIRQGEQYLEAVPSSLHTSPRVNFLIAQLAVLRSFIAQMEERAPSASRIDDLRRVLDETPSYLRMAAHAWLPALVILVDMNDATLADVTDAERRIRAALAAGMDNFSSVALHRGLAKLAAIEADLSPGRPGYLVSEIMRRHRSAYELAMANSFTEATSIAMDWGEVAAQHDLADQAAEAYLIALRTARRFAHGSLTRGERTARVREANGAAVEAAYWLTACHKNHEAVLALETGRALLMSEVIERDQIEERLREYGHTRLADRYREVIAELRALEPGGRDTAWMFTPEGRARRATLDAARSRWDGLVQEIRGLPGFESFSPTLAKDD